MELISLHQPEEFGKGQKETPQVRPPPRILLSSIPSWLNKACTTRKDSESEWLAKDNPETNPITIKPKTASHVAELFSWVPLPYCSPTGCPFPTKFLALSADVSPWTIHFWILDKSPVLAPERGPLSCNSLNHFYGSFLLGFPWPIIFIFLVQNLCLIYLRILRCVHRHLASLSQDGF